ncbi:TPA: hypothetical protein QDB15_004854 [Burkholderia vietnamiensis]|uniref:hypothetical protein n=1 Tax=Burkholderia vietnamiensis TaxID=60552 RepID=UPI0015932E4F|nr:hypothetical protein [Burkholderia vietnamiensis]MCA8210166.1 hypothetical protein [Burkholderia vietnamiensis]HDR9018055.1 hypothetical protein [Burkholderia vietnamiensis]HDR9101275.1 hypothetical protein [Burkholderia vietnamiensis]HDR9121020.1 hypothetical protein [Burkholderia vietnamiensis]
MERKSPFDLAGFEPRQPSRQETRPSPEVVDQIAAETGFPSRSPALDSKSGGGGVAETEPTSAPVSVRTVARLGSGSTDLPADNRRRTGRNIQKNFKLTAQNIVDLEFEASHAKITFGEVVERGIAAIRKLREMGIDDY